MFSSLWLDDQRPIPSHFGTHWTAARSFHEAIFKLEIIEFKEISFDHDLGSFYGYKEMTGYDVALWLVQRKLDGFQVPTKYHIHSANPVGRENIQALIDQYLAPV